MRAAIFRLAGDETKVIRAADNPELTDFVGKTLITTDGTTLLGSDDKSGVAVIMELAHTLIEHPQLPHGPIRILFTCDEEIGHGIDHVDLTKLGATVCYTLDGQGAGEIDTETFSADLATVTVRGVNIHPSIGKGRMVNALRVAAAASSTACRKRASRPKRPTAATVFCIPTRSKAALPSVKDQSPATRFRHCRAGDKSRHASQGRPRSHGRHSRLPDRRANHQAVSQHGRRADQGAASGRLCPGGFRR